LYLIQTVVASVRHAAGPSQVDKVHWMSESCVGETETYWDGLIITHATKPAPVHARAHAVTSSAC